jgi:hypothetical protein
METMCYMLQGRPKVLFSLMQQLVENNGEHDMSKWVSLAFDRSTKSMQLCKDSHIDDLLFSHLKIQASQFRKVGANTTNDSTVYTDNFFWLSLGDTTGTTKLQIYAMFVRIIHNGVESLLQISVCSREKAMTPVRLSL